MTSWQTILSNNLPFRNTSESEKLVLDLLRSNPEPLSFEQIITRLPDLSWNQVFIAVDSLSRSGKIILNRKGYEYEAMAADFV